MRAYFLRAVMVLLCAAPAAQQPPGSPEATTPQPGVTFRTETNFVEVHAIVTDERGAFVRDLRQEDFEILEDGRPQKPSVFSLVDLPVDPPVTPAGRAEPVESDVRMATRTFDGRIYVLLLDDLHTTFARTSLVKDVAKRFIQRYLGSNDLAAVVHASGRQEAGQELTNRRRLLIAAIDRFQGRKLPSAGVERLAVHLRENAAADAVADESRPIRTSEGLQAARSVRDPGDPERGLNARRTLEAVGRVASWLSDVQGRRKALLLFSEGIDYDIYQPFNQGAEASLVADAQEAVAAAQRANVNVYAVDPRGLAQFSDMVDVNARSDYPQLEYGSFRGALRELLLAQESLISLADETGGLAIVNKNDVAGGLGRVVLDNSRYYLLGYYSDSSRWSGRFLKLDVRVRRPGVQVRARRGYLPPKPGRAATPRRSDTKNPTSAALKAALGKPVPVGGLPLRVFAAPFKGSGRNASVFIAAEIDGRALRFQERDGRFTDNLEVSIVATDERAKVQGEDRQQFDLKLMPQTYEKVRRTGVRLLSRLEMPPARYQIRVGAHETGTGAVAAVPYDLEVPDYAGSAFALSGLVLTSSAADALATANQDARLTGVLPAPPVAVRRFSSSETVTCFAEIYDNSSAAAHSVSIVATVQEAGGGRTVFRAADERAAGASRTQQTHGFMTSIALRDLSPGAYVLRVEGTTGGRSAVREVPFEVTN